VWRCSVISIGLNLDVARESLIWFLFASGFASLILKFFRPTGREILARALFYLAVQYREPEKAHDEACQILERLLEC
jgi:hypothetical protein